MSTGALPAGLTLDASTGVISGTPTALGSSSFTVQVTDASAQVATRALGITIIAGGLPTYTAFGSGAVPGGTAAQPGPIEVGVKFRADVDGFLTGVRFYKATTNTGTHVGNLWTSTGTKLATATFTGETASGWQQVDFAAPVAITAGTVYVASYHTSSGVISYTGGGMVAGVDSPPLHLLADGVSGPNGVYVFAAAGTFPSSGYHGANYWVDVAFSPAAAPPPSIDTASLPGGTVGVAYTATLSASGGTLPLSWSVSTGALPAGLTLDASTGVISGTPTALGSSSFTVQVTDASAQVATRALGITIVAGGLPTYTAFGSGAVPGGTAAQPGPIEVGVKFRADVDGFLTGVRFYKATTNTGTHVGNLWTSTGTKLATATFTGETASGWQQVDFAAPVAITAGTVYVASYHTSSGVISYTGGGMVAGVDSPPLHLLADGVSGPNGVYVFAAAGTFPSRGYHGANYWVDVAFSPAAAPPPSIDTASLPGGTVGVAYTATLSASGGTLPLSWSVSTGALPAGLTLDASTGVISGTPTALGSSSFAVQVTDASAQVATRALGITIIAGGLPTYTAFGSGAVPGGTAAQPGPIEVGVKFRADVDGFLTGVRFYKATTNTGTHVGNLWTSTGTKLATATFTGETASGWQQVDFAAPVAITAGTVYVASYHTSSGVISYTGGGMVAGVDSPPLHLLANGVSGPNGVYVFAAAGTFPSNGYNGANYWVDVAFSPATTP